MITIGLVKELYFISSVLNTSFDFFIGHPDSQYSILLRVKDKVLEIQYAGQWIWKETIEGDTSYFGVESCDTISRIITSINNNDMESAREMFYFEKLFDK